MNWQNLYNKTWKKWALGIGGSTVLIFGLRDVAGVALNAISKVPSAIWYGLDDVAQPEEKKDYDKEDKEPAGEPESKAGSVPDGLETKLDKPVVPAPELTSWTLRNQEGFVLYKMEVPRTPETRRVLDSYTHVVRITPKFSDIDATGDALDMDTGDGKLDGKADYASIQAVVSRANERRKSRQGFGIN